MVQVYMTDASNLPDPQEFPEVLAGLSEERKQKILRYQQPESRKTGLGAGLLLRYVLKLNGKSMEDIRYGEHGKPEMDESGFYFNLSHSHGKVVCAVSEKVVGCDIEKIQEARMGIARRFFCESEVAYLNRFEGIEKDQEFYRLWTMKESYIKMTGDGLRFPLNEFEFILEDSQDQVKILRNGAFCDCSIKEYQVPGFKLTVCAEEADFVDDVKAVNL